MPGSKEHSSQAKRYMDVVDRREGLAHELGSKKITEPSPTRIMLQSPPIAFVSGYRAESG